MSACPPIASALVLVAMILHLTVSANLLFLCGIDYAHPGGNPIVKFHPASVAILLAFGIVLFEDRTPLRNLAAMARAHASLVVFVGCMVAVMVWSTICVGPSGVAIYVESYLTAGLAALVCRRLSDTQAVRLGRVVLALVAINIVIGLGETALQTHLVPVYLEQSALVDAPGEFRPAALFDHPLTASAVTMTVLLSLGGLRLGRAMGAAATALLALGLLDWGERAALGVTAIIVVARLIVVEGANLAHRRLTPARAMSLAALAACTPVAVALLASSTAIGARLSSHLGADGSTEARAAQWDILGNLDLRAWLFGTPIADFPSLIYKVGLTEPLTGIESFWLFALLDLGLLGFAIYLVGVFGLFAHLRRIASPAGRLAVIALIVVASASNSLGRKCNILVVLVACIEAGARRSVSGLVERAP